MTRESSPSAAHYPIVRLSNGQRTVDLRVDEVVVDPKAIRSVDGSPANNIVSLSVSDGELVHFLIYSNSEAFRMILSGRIRDLDGTRRSVLRCKHELSVNENDFAAIPVCDRQYSIRVQGVVQKVLPDVGMIVGIMQQGEEQPSNALQLKFVA